MLSVVAFVAVLISWSIARYVNPCKTSLPLLPDCYISFSTIMGDARLHVFNDRRGPYNGGIVALAGSYPGDPKTPTGVGVGDAAGVYFRYICWPDGHILWTLSVSLVYPLTVFAILPLLWLNRRSRIWRRGFPVNANGPTHDQSQKTCS
ncbi:MAG TPA: hypothetical protein VM008_03215 [Phycisphaerae bacterium]|nr:hypothetical protein [Phycisphaerae bacterium]